MSEFFFFNDTATTEIYTLSLHDALPIYMQRAPRSRPVLATQPIRRMNTGETAREVPGQRTVESGGGRGRRRLRPAVVWSLCPGVLHAHPMSSLAAPAPPAWRCRDPHPRQPVDDAAPRRPRGRPSRRPHPQSRRPAAGERPPAPAGARPPPVGPAARLHPARPRPAGPPGEPAADLGQRAPDRPARDRAALAPPGVPAPLATHVGTTLPA